MTSICLDISRGEPPKSDFLRGIAGYFDDDTAPG